MANPIKPKSTTTASKVPGTGDLITGELASNIADGVLFLKKSDGTIATFGTGTGTVSSVAMTVPTGLTITGSPITTTGTLAITFTSGYSIPTTSKQTTWDTAYSERQQWDGGSTNLVAATARTSLGLVIGTNVQAWDADLDSIAGLAGTSGLLKKTAANTWSLDTSTYLTANQSITLSGDISGTGSTSISTTLATVTIAKGGTGQTTQQAAINALTGTQSSGKYLRSDGTNASLSSIQAADVPTLNQNTTGSSASCTGNAATATSATNLAGGGAGQIPYNTGSGATSFLAAGTAGQLLQSNGASAPSWTSQGLYHGGRISLQSGVPVSNSDQTAKTTIYFTPFNGDKISLYDGTAWAAYTFTERSLSLGTLTSAKNYDVFIYNNSGTLALELSAAWTSDTARSDAITLLNGIYVKSTNNTRRYLGTIRTTSTTTTEDSLAKRFVWNFNNKVLRSLYLNMYSSSHTFNGTAREWNNGTGITRVQFVTGINGETFIANAYVAITSGGFACNAFFGMDSTTVQFGPTTSDDRASAFTRRSLTSVGQVDAGYHYLTMLQSTESAGTSTFLDVVGGGAFLC